MRPTVNDIAREAGVSLATVDRVLNARPGVRDKTIRAVNDAITKLGYVRDLTAANLARSRTYRMAVVLPDTESQFHSNPCSKRCRCRLGRRHQPDRAAACTAFRPRIRMRWPRFWPACRGATMPGLR